MYGLLYSCETIKFYIGFFLFSTFYNFVFLLLHSFWTSTNVLLKGKKKRLSYTNGIVCLHSTLCAATFTSWLFVYACTCLHFLFKKLLGLMKQGSLYLCNWCECSAFYCMFLLSFKLLLLCHCYELLFCFLAIIKTWMLAASVLHCVSLSGSLCCQFSNLKIWEWIL